MSLGFKGARWNFTLDALINPSVVLVIVVVLVAVVVVDVGIFHSQQVRGIAIVRLEAPIS